MASNSVAAWKDSLGGATKVAPFQKSHFPAASKSLNDCSAETLGDPSYCIGLLTAALSKQGSTSRDFALIGVWWCRGDAADFGLQSCVEAFAEAEGEFEDAFVRGEDEDVSRGVEDR